MEKVFLLLISFFMLITFEACGGEENDESLSDLEELTGYIKDEGIKTKVEGKTYSGAYFNSKEGYFCLCSNNDKAADYTELFVYSIGNTLQSTTSQKGVVEISNLMDDYVTTDKNGKTYPVTLSINESGGVYDITIRFSRLIYKTTYTDNIVVKYHGKVISD